MTHHECFLWAVNRLFGQKMVIMFVLWIYFENCVRNYIAFVLNNLFIVQSNILYFFFIYIYTCIYIPPERQYLISFKSRANNSIALTSRVFRGGKVPCHFHFLIIIIVSLWCFYSCLSGWPHWYWYLTKIAFHPSWCSYLYCTL